MTLNHAPDDLDLSDPRLIALAALSSPLWLTELEQPTLLWANRAGLAFWQVDSLEQLRQRAPSPTRTTLDQFELTRARVERGQRATERWTLYPNGQPVRCRLTSSALTLDQGRQVMLVEAQPLQEHDQDSAGLRAIEALRYTSAMISLYSELGYLIMHNPAAQRAFGEQTRFEQRFADSAQALRALNQLSRQEPFEELIESKTAQGTRWHQLQVKASLDPVTGQRTLLVNAQDVTAALSRDKRLATLERFLTQELLKHHELPEALAARARELLGLKTRSDV